MSYIPFSPVFDNSSCSHLTVTFINSLSAKIIICSAGMIKGQIQLDCFGTNNHKAETLHHLKPLDNIGKTEKKFTDLHLTYKV